MTFNTILVENNDAVALITLKREDAMNAVCAAMAAELTRALKTLDDDDAIRCVVLTGSPSFFAAGADMTEFDGEHKAEIRKIYAELARAFAEMRKPVVAGVAGYAFGIGFELALLSDIVIAAENARFGFPEISLGVLTQMGGAAILAARIGKPRAMEMVLTGRHLSAKEALDAGIVSRMVDSSLIKEETLQTAARIASMSAAGVRLAKQAVLAGAKEADCLKNQESLAALSLLSDDAAEAMNALKEQRAPNFSHKDV